MLISLLIFAFVSSGIAVSLWIKYGAANHTARVLLEKLKNTAAELDELKRQSASLTLTLDAMRLERTHGVSQPSQNSNHTGDSKKRKYSRRPKNQ
jgi:hypothetical protein